MDRLELVVHQGGLYERRKLGGVVDEQLEIGEQSAEFVRWWRHESSRLDGGARCADPVLRPPDLSGAALRTARAGEDHRVHLADEADTQRQAPQKVDALLHGSDVVHHLLDIGGERPPARLGVEDIAQGGLDPLDARR